MRKDILRLLTEILISGTAFGVAIIAVISNDKWFNQGQLSEFGIYASVFAIAALFGGAVLAISNFQKTASEKEERRAIENLAHQEIRDSIRHMVWPLIMIGDVLYSSYCDIPKAGEPIKINKPSDFLEPDAIKRLSTFNLYGKKITLHMKARNFMASMVA